MNQFLIKISFRLIIFILMIFIIGIFVHKTDALQTSFLIDKETKYLFFGSSLSECALNDDLIDNSINLSRSSECYFYNYFKIKMVLEDNPKFNIESIFLDYSNILIGPSHDEWIWGYEKMSTFLPIYLPFFEQNDIRILLKNSNKLDLIKSVLASIKLNIIHFII